LGGAEAVEKLAQTQNETISYFSQIKLIKLFQSPIQNYFFPHNRHLWVFSTCALWDFKTLCKGDFQSIVVFG